MKKTIFAAIIGLAIVVVAVSYVSSGCSKQIGEDTEFPGGSDGDGDGNPEDPDVDNTEESSHYNDSSETTEKIEPIAEQSKAEENVERNITIRVNNKEVLVNNVSVDYEINDMEDLTSKLQTIISDELIDGKELILDYNNGNDDVDSAIDELLKEMGVNPIKKNEE